MTFSPIEISGHGDGSILCQEPTRGMRVDFQAETFPETMVKAGFNPQRHFKKTKFTGVDMEDIDLAGWDLSEARLEQVDMSRVKNITEAVFSSATVFDDTKLPAGITVEMLIG